MISTILIVPESSDKCEDSGKQPELQTLLPHNTSVTSVNSDQTRSFDDAQLITGDNSNDNIAHDSDSINEPTTSNYGHLNSVEIIVKQRSPSPGSDGDSDSEYVECYEDVFPIEPLPVEECREDMLRLRRATENVTTPHDLNLIFNRRSRRSSMPLSTELEEGEDSDEEMDPDLDVNIEEEIMAACFPSLDSAKTHAGEFVKRVWEASWKVTNFHYLPEWLQDNDYLHQGHRPPLPSFGACFNSIFRLHTETGNIWSHMIGCVAFIGMAGWFLTRPTSQVGWQEKLVFSAFFTGAIACLGLSFAFHTVNCHSEKVGRIFSKLDYVGISTMVVGSFIPWLYYGFYCYFTPWIVYTICISVLGAGGVVVSLWDRFATPRFRPLRAGVFIALGLSGVIPCVHLVVIEGVWRAINEAALGWLILMAILYIGGAVLYALRIPERFFPGKFDLWFQSHQIFHLAVVIAAFVHYHGMTEMALFRLQGPPCPL